MTMIQTAATHLITNGRSPFNFSPTFLTSIAHLPLLLVQTFSGNSGKDKTAVSHDTVVSIIHLIDNSFVALQT
ncbi:MAG: hypothetical protein GY796_30670 [Chloroflexi bacterium]|nr:hypothetical protein [Chloroflexota bacterium]